MVINNGGYIQIGKAVIVSFKMTLSATIPANTKVATGLPAENANGASLVIGGVNANSSCRINGAQGIFLNEALTEKEYFVSGAYITA